MRRFVGIVIGIIGIVALGLLMFGICTAEVEVIAVDRYAGADVLNDHMVDPGIEHIPVIALERNGVERGYAADLVAGIVEHIRIP